MLVPVLVSVVPVPKVTGTPLPWGIGTSILGTGTTASLHVGTGTSKCGTGTTAFANCSSSLQHYPGPLDSGCHQQR